MSLNRVTWGASLILVASAGTAAAAPPDPMARLADEFRRDVAILAADDMEGRGLGTEGLRRSADWIEQRLRALGLAPAFGRSYRQPFRVKAGVALAAPGADGRPANELDGIAPDDWTPLGLSSSGAFSGELAFVGYGIEAPPVGYRELDGVDLAGKVVLVLRYEPQERDEASPFDGKRPSRWSGAALQGPAGAREGRGRGRVRDRARAGRREGPAPGAEERRAGERGRHPRAPGEALGRAEMARRVGNRPAARSRPRWTAT